MIERIVLIGGLLAALCVGHFAAVADESPITQCGPNRGHDCHCPRMVQRRRDEDIEKCMAIQNQHEYDLCMAEIPTLCQMVAHPRQDPVTGALEPDTCFKYCKYQGLCFCSDTRCDANGDPLSVQAPPTPKQKAKGKKKK